MRRKSQRDKSKTAKRTLNILAIKDDSELSS